MGIAPSEVLAMPLHDYQAAFHHWTRANSSEDDDEPLSETDFDEMLDDMASAGIH
jgi:hypothetical protein